MAVSSLASCVGAGISTALCATCGSTFNSFAARLVYAIAFVLNSMFAWLSLNDWVIGKLDLLKQACKGDSCTGFVAVQRITMALGLLNVVLAIILSVLPAATPVKTREEIQNGWWRLKFVGWLVFLILGFMIPPGFWVFWGNNIAPIGSAVFIAVGLVILVDCAYLWAETCVANIEESEDPRWWQGVLVGSTLGMYACAVVLSIVMYAFFAGGGCSMNQAVVTLNILFAIVVSVISIHPSVQEHNPRAGLAQAAMVAVYCTYLTMSAVSSEPDDHNCNPLVRSRGTRTASIVLGAIFTFVAIGYTTTRAASRTFGAGDEEQDTDDTEARELRSTALRQAVEEGTLPASALEESEWESSSSGGSYNYVRFHLIFFVAALYTATLLTMNVTKDPDDNFIPVGRTYHAAWTKILSSWVCYVLYAWTLAAPVIMPERFA